MESRFEIFKTVRGEATKNGYVETSVGCNGDLHAEMTGEVYLEDSNYPDSEHLDFDEISRHVTGPCDHTCASPIPGCWFLCETAKTRPKLFLVN